ncbi:hypothetical protein ACET3Z_028955 [Daucus carota]
MIQSFMPSCFSSSIQLQPEKGMLVPLQSQRRHTKTLNQDKEYKYTGPSSSNIINATDIFSSSCNKLRVYKTQHIQTFCTTSDAEFLLQPKDNQKATPLSRLWEEWDAFYRFCRIYTVTGMVAGVSSVSVLPLTSVGELSPAFFVGMLQALFPFVILNMYVVGINQLADVEIDKINKPHLPLASGEYSVDKGITVVSAFGFMCLTMGIMFQSPPLFIGIVVYILLGTAYSIKLPLLRWKTNPYLAAFCVVGGHGLIIQPAVFYHIQDIPDVEGDQAFGNRTFSVRHGKKKVFSICVGILLFAYGSGVVVGASSSFLICKIVSVIGHSALASLFLLRAKSLNLDDDVATQSFYMFLWKIGAMIQTFRSSSQYWSLQHLRPEKDIFRSSCNQQRTYRDQLVQTFRTTSDGEFVIEPNDDKKVTPQSNLWAKWDAFYRFCQLYTATGVVIGVSSVSVLPLTSVGDLSPAFFVGLLQALITFVILNMYVVGINQLADVEIDKINKPHLPLASGEYSMEKGTTVVSAFGFMCLAMGIKFRSPPFFVGIVVYILLGTAYSIKLPLLRWKTNPYLAAFCVVGGHGLIIQPAVFYHIQHVLGKPFTLNKSVVFATIFFSLFSVVIALFKDIPDVEGDRAFGNLTFSVRHGKKNVFSICVGILLFAYGSGAVIGHSTLASLFLLRAKSLDLDDDVATQSFYMFLWKLFSAEYLLIHFLR